MKSILGIGNALVDILAVTDSNVLSKFNLPKGSMQLVKATKSRQISDELRKHNCLKVAGGSAANTLSGTARLGMRSAFIGKIGRDELGDYFKADLDKCKVESQLLYSTNETGRSNVIISPDGERTMATFLGAAIDLKAEDLSVSMFDSYNYLHLEGYLVQNHALIERAAYLAKDRGLTISLDLASYNVVEENREFLTYLLEKYVDIVFANEDESRAFAKATPLNALKELGKLCDIAVVKLGKAGAYIQQGDILCKGLAQEVRVVDTTGAGDLYAAGFLYGISEGKDVSACAHLGAICASKVIGTVGPKLSDAQWAQIANMI